MSVTGSILRGLAAGAVGTGVMTAAQTAYYEATGEEPSSVPVLGLAAAGRRPGSGVLFGLAVWATSLVHLPAMKLAPPVWEYDPKTLASDVGFHLVYGVATATAYKALDRT